MTRTVWWIGAVVLAAGCSKEVDDYKRKSMASEGELVLHKLRKALQESAVATGGFPVGHAELTPAKSCCEYPDQRCPPGEEFAGEPWRSLGIAMADPHRFRFDYDSDGKTATAHAVGDLGCDGKPVTMTLTAKLPAGASDVPEIVILNPLAPARK